MKYLLMLLLPLTVNANTHTKFKPGDCIIHKDSELWDEEPIKEIMEIGRSHYSIWIRIIKESGNYSHHGKDISFKEAKNYDKIDCSTKTN